ncbi:MAG TPA: 3-dehydroquinate synthase [Candidatus Methylacidiphilales bacterium]|jgi:3-dehydroquinate synthase|nr:3-dehydroquinate synthase [Candidatus Methylacidiphilales bacterium]
MTTSSPSLPPHRTVRVDLGPRSYDVVIGRGLINHVGELMSQRGMHKTAALITDKNIDLIIKSRTWAGLYGDNWNFLTRDFCAIDSGEQSKSLEQAAKLLSELAKMRLPRSGAVVALGGGVIGDLAGFVAATYLRGIAFVQVPTTLLAMVDSSVGGKTGVNLPEGKNLVGAFHQPKLVVADLDTLKTLPPREFAAGMAEVIKYGAIKDKALFDRVAQGVKPDDKDLDEIVEKCVTIKARIVEKDEFETTGERALLNFGHTLGHAIEAATEYKQYLHGEAIALGMRAAAWLSYAEHKLSEDEVYALEDALKANHLPTELPPNATWSNSSQIFAFIGRDKKIKDGVFQWVLLDKIGQARSGFATPSNKNPLIEDIIRHLVQPIHTRFPREGYR